VLFGLVLYLLNRQARANPIFRSAIAKLVEGRDSPGDEAAKPVANPSK
jgi:hypothetical protein